MIDFISTVGRYAAEAMFVNSCGVQLEEGNTRFPS